MKVFVHRAARAGSNMLEGIGRVLFPPVCLGCAEIVSRPGALCVRCWPQTRFLERPWCEIMGTPFSHEMGDGFLSAAAIAEPPPFARARAAVAYSGTARRLVSDLKFRDRTDLAPWMARWMQRAGAELFSDAHLIVPVPLHRMRYLGRQFNQAAELSRALSRLTAIAFAPAVLSRVRSTRRQVGLKAKERAENVRGAFRVGPEHEAAVRGRNIVLVDDVLTTGATVSAATRALMRAGAARVDVLTFARVLPGDTGREDTAPGDFRETA